METVTQDFKKKVDQRISSMGIKKSYLASQMGLDPVRFSQTMKGIRKIQPTELSKLKSCLGMRD
ncbi:hypothetical protein [Sphingobacterium mizutaii]|uniref:hypothetical protein n=1 Tax=Sphingobacterium mizutaii TaxID=1010 RepID=UPI00289EBA03|nr:hypothetical protein [Sphingobacterium mizutaii]